jgi:hypothetical protein
VEHLPPDSNFFTDLGADSMIAARFCARLRKRTDLPSLSVKDVYQHRTLSSLATALAADLPADGPTIAPEKPATRTTEPARRARTGEYVLCGALQLLLYLVYSSAGIVVVIRGYEWIAAGHTLIDEYLRAVVFGGAALVVLATFPILAKWVLIGRWKPKQIRVWSLGYLRFWIVKTLIRSNPLVLLTGGRSHTSTSSPLHVLYLRALGAKIGRGVAPVSTRPSTPCPVSGSSSSTRPTPRGTRRATSASRSRPANSRTSTSPPAPPASPRVRCASTRAW